MAEDRPSRVVTVPTSEGPTYYPFGAWGRGYILDGPARSAMDTYLRRIIIWIMVPCFPISDGVGAALGLDRLMSAFGGWLVFCAIHAGMMLFILRHCRTTTGATPEELLRLSIEQRGYLAVESSYWCGLIVSAGAAVCAGISLDGLERALFVAVATVASVSTGRQLWRVKRLDAV